jgi:hypothetical protein
MIVESDNLMLLDKIPIIKDFENTPDIVIYSSVCQKNIINPLKELDYNDKNLIFFSDNSKIVYKNLDTNVFPLFLENIRHEVEKVTTFSFNSCLIQKGIWTNFTKSNQKKIIPTILIGYDTLLTFKNSSNYKKWYLDIKNLSLIIRRENMLKYWTTEMSNDKSELPFFTITFLDFFIEHVDNNLKKNIKLDGKLSFSSKKIYLSTFQRVLFKQKIKQDLYNMHTDIKLPEGSRCIMQDTDNKLNKYIKIKKKIGSGDWGNVFSGCLKSDFFCKRKFAIKMSRITDSDFENPYSDTSFSWNEIWILKDIITPIIENNICPNLPLYMDTFLCNKCDFIYKGKQKVHPCITNIVELASGDLKKYFSLPTISDDQLYSALFQIMAGLHALQMVGQIFINDIKAANILYYDVKPGGYWHYKINNKHFYVPNYGHMFILNDFGVSKLYNPNFQLYPKQKTNVFNLGSRYAININEKFHPIEAGYEFKSDSIKKTIDVLWKDKQSEKFSKGATYNIDRKTGQVICSDTKLTFLQKSYLFKNGINTNSTSWDFFEHPYIIPPFEFYNDVQDVLRTFVGGKRSSQKGNHKIHKNISTLFRETIKPYLGISRSSNLFIVANTDNTDIFRTFSTETYEVLAGSFISKFFTNTVDYTLKLNGLEISFFDMKFTKK